MPPIPLSAFGVSPESEEDFAHAAAAAARASQRGADYSGALSYTDDDDDDAASDDGSEPSDADADAAADADDRAIDALDDDARDLFWEDFSESVHAQRVEDAKRAGAEPPARKDPHAHDPAARARRRRRTLATDYAEALFALLAWGAGLLILLRATGWDAGLVKAARTELLALVVPTLFVVVLFFVELRQLRLPSRVAISGEAGDS